MCGGGVGGGEGAGKVNCFHYEYKLKYIFFFSWGGDEGGVLE